MEVTRAPEARSVVVVVPLAGRRATVALQPRFRTSPARRSHEMYDHQRNGPIPFAGARRGFGCTPRQRRCVNYFNARLLVFDMHGSLKPHGYYSIHESVVR